MVLPQERLCYHTRCHFEKRSRASNEERLAPHTNAASASDLAFLCYSQLHHVIRDLFGVSNYAIKLQELFQNMKGSSFHFQLIFMRQEKVLRHSRILLCCWSNQLHPCEIIVCPDRNNAVTFINRKQFSSVNVQAVSDSKALNTNIVARLPGTTHDSHNF